MNDIETDRPDGEAALQIWLEGPTRFAKVYTHQARLFAATDGMPREVAVWFAALDRVDSVGHAVFDSGELEKVLGCKGDAISRALAKSKSVGLIDHRSNSRHVWLIGAEDGSQYGQNLAEKRFALGIGYPGPGKGLDAA